VTYDHRPRFGTNYVGLRNRISVRPHRTRAAQPSLICISLLVY
jgi:hypothetical protein